VVFGSILFPEGSAGPPPLVAEAPACLSDLNLNQVIEAITAGREEVDLQPFFFTPLHNADAIRYRQEVAQDLEEADGVLLDGVRSFAQRMVEMRRARALVEKLPNRYHRQGWFLEGVRRYGEAIVGLLETLERAELRSRGLIAFREYLREYVRSAGFTSLLQETQALKQALEQIRYTILIRGSRVEVREYRSETDYSVEVEETFARFKQGAVKDYSVPLGVHSGLNHVEAAILDRVARLYPAQFSALDDYCTRHRGYLDETIARFDREIQFYVAYQEFTARIRRAGLAFCYPRISATGREIWARDAFDLALAAKRASVVPNDFHLSDPERILVISGPNQGGKTTFARMFGQLHYLASLGCAVPGRAAQLALFDRLFTHFEKEEDIRNLRGKLQDDLVRIRAILDQATPESIIILNEIFTSTTLSDGIFLSRRILERILELDALCVWVTFIEELATASEKTVSMISTVAPENPALRTYKFVRRPPDGLAYAIAIAQKHGLTYAQLRERLAA